MMIVPFDVTLHNSIQTYWNTLFHSNLCMFTAISHLKYISYIWITLRKHCYTSKVIFRFRHKWYTPSYIELSLYLYIASNKTMYKNNTKVSTIQRKLTSFYEPPPVLVWVLILLQKLFCHVIHNWSIPIRYCKFETCNPRPFLL